ncbi:hypothetical protein [Phocaeicola vulgatus]|uniref:hypothetical protein n=1 Tax=Phocaeicola vulgatus TaxID=821 RepID=UPI0021666440|nr:hypothetical protein [Phocaeicola vulgatus]MCS3107098.1 hypothetical protein [Phocaeicola vulgatus]
MVCIFRQRKPISSWLKFTLLGATWNGQKVPKSIFTDGITASVKGYDYVADQNHIPLL